MADRHVLLVHRDSPMAAHAVIEDPRKLDGLALVGTRRVCRADQVEEQLRAAGVSFTIPFRSDDNLTVRSPERGITSMAEVEAIVNDYVRQAARWDTSPPSHTA